MEFAVDRTGKRIHASEAIKEKQYFCPLCDNKVILRQGEINIEHFAHIKKCDDNWHYDVSEWHSEWQNQFPKNNQEIVIEYNGEKHRADVMACGHVIEFQHSPITAEEFNKRNRFYLSYGKKVIWIFDFRNEFENGLMECYDEWHRNKDNGGKFMWKYAKRFLQNYLPQRDKNIIVFFQIAEADYTNKKEAYLERVIWTLDEDGMSNFKRFYTSYYPANFFELLEWVKNKKL
jgi:competence CoiA-like predicted nuclease